MSCNTSNQQGNDISLTRDHYHPPSTSKTLQDQAVEFRQAYNLSGGTSQRGVQKSLIDEEWSEFHEAFHHQSPAEQLEELADIHIVLYQFCANEDWDLDEAVRRKQEANLSKLGEDGKPILRGDGKVLKGPNYKKATFEDLGGERKNCYNEFRILSAEQINIMHI